jgi:thioredoxin-dependent peroxiredoxin
MPVELRKRPPPKETAAPPPAAKRGSSSKVKQLADKAKKAVLGDDAKDENTAAAPEQPTTDTSAPVIPETVPQGPTSASNGSAKSGGKLTVGDNLNLDGFGGTIQTHDGADVTVKDLLEKSGAGVVIFTYPKASTPGCKYST